MSGGRYRGGKTPQRNMTAAKTPSPIAVAAEALGTTAANSRASANRDDAPRPIVTTNAARFCGDGTPNATRATVTSRATATIAATTFTASSATRRAAGGTG